MSDTSQETPSLPQNQRKLLNTLAIATIVVVIAAIWASWANRQIEKPTFETTPMFPALIDQINDVSKLTIQPPEGEAFTIVRGEGLRWMVPEKYNFSADPQQLKETVVGLAELDLVEKRTARSDWHHHLGLAEGAEEGNGVKVSVFGVNDQAIAELIVGNELSLGDVGGKKSVYVRRPGEDQTYVGRGNLEIDQEVAKWIEKDIIDTYRGRVRSVSITPAGGKAYTIQRDKPEDNDFKILRIPRGREARSAASANGIGSALSDLDFEDVKPIGEVKFGKASKAVYKTFDGLVVTIETVIEEENDIETRWAKISAAHDPASAIKIEDETKTPGLKQPDEVKREAELLNAKHSDWAYQLQTWVANNFSRPMEDMLKPLEGQ